jgi:hypothetical protein
MTSLSDETREETNAYSDHGAARIQPLTGEFGLSPLAEKYTQPLAALRGQDTLRNDRMMVECGLGE